MLGWKRRRAQKIKRTSLKRKRAGDFEVDTVLAERNTKHEVTSLKSNSPQTREAETRDDRVPAAGHPAKVV